MDNEISRKREVVHTCLEEFISKGLFETTSRDLSRALKLKSGGLYYYFATKDDAVIACAEEATWRLEQKLIYPAIKSIADPDRLIAQLLQTADEMAPAMSFLVQVCSTEKYKERMKPTLDRMAFRYQQYAGEIAEKLHVRVADIEVCLYMCITAVTNYMVFRETAYVLPQLQYVADCIKKLTSQAPGITERRTQATEGSTVG